ncbi:hypothetical protein GCM10010129_41140 [Streptomyces fumigatiscleroticus]|nr:hypothetical protein GCM10010129_41140 [Streptomyces fumigatiscleroticus]
MPEGAVSGASLRAAAARLRAVRGRRKDLVRHHGGKWRTKPVSTVSHPAPDCAPSGRKRRNKSREIYGPGTGTDARRPGRRPERVAHGASRTTSGARVRHGRRPRVREVAQAGR